MQNTLRLMRAIRGAFPQQLLSSSRKLLPSDSTWCPTPVSTNRDGVPTPQSSQYFTLNPNFGEYQYAVSEIQFQ